MQPAAAWIELLKRSALLKIGWSVALAIGLVIAAAAVAAVASILQAKWERTIGNAAP